MARGKKTCPKCNTEMGARAGQCPSCKYVFEKKQEVPEVVTRVAVTESKTLVESGKTIRKTSPKEHAKRIVSYGKTRASALLLQSRRLGWGHVDWNYVEENLKSCIE